MEGLWGGGGAFIGLTGFIGLIELTGFRGFIRLLRFLGFRGGRCVWVESFTWPDRKGPRDKRSHP